MLNYKLSSFFFRSLQRLEFLDYIKYTTTTLGLEVVIINTNLLIYIVHRKPNNCQNKESCSLYTLVHKNLTIFGSIQTFKKESDFLKVIHVSEKFGFSTLLYLSASSIYSITLLLFFTTRTYACSEYYSFKKFPFKTEFCIFLKHESRAQYLFYQRQRKFRR